MSIENEFYFLIENGFSIRKYLRVPDEECVYVKDNIELDVENSLGILDNGI